MRGLLPLFFLTACGGFQREGAAGSLEGLSLGDDRSCAYWSNDEVRCWGHRAPGGDDGDDLIPTLQPALRGVQGLAVSGGYNCAILRDGTVDCWGEQAASWSGLFGVKQLTTYITRGCAATEGGSLLCGATFAPPSAMPDMGVVIASALSSDFSCALDAHGGVRCWGKNDLGQLGDGSGDDQAAPSPVVLDEPAVEIGAGDQHACARGESGHVWCWGSNGYGQLGSGAPGAGLFQPTPVRVPLEGVAQLGVGASGTCARLAGGEVYCWGSNGNGQLGDGTGEPSVTPVRVVGLPAVEKLQVGAEHACASAGSALYCWGANATGQLGDGTRDDRLQPVRVRL
jgi:hypothetical protein